MGEKYAYNFGCLPPMPTGYRVEWWECDEHYHWVYGDEDDHDYTYSVCCWSPHWCRRAAFDHAKENGRG